MRQHFEAPRFALAATFLAAVLAATSVEPVVAQSPERGADREVLLGVAVTGQGKVNHDARGPGAGATPLAAGQTAGDENDANLQLDLARDRMAAGDHAKARVVLESLMARQPASRAAAEARSMLDRQPGATLPPTTSIRTPSPNDASSRPVAVAPTAPETARATERLDDQFRSVVGDRVYFDDESYVLDQRAADVLTHQAMWLRSHPRAVIVIEGHADDRGNPDQNAALAINRAEAVRQRLTMEGVAPEQIRIVGYGRDRRVALCNQEACKEQNRRAVTIVGPLNREARLRGIRD